MVVILTKTFCLVKRGGFLFGSNGMGTGFTN